MSQKIASINHVSHDVSRNSCQHWASIALAGFAMFVVIMLLMHVLHPEFDPATRFLSEYALGGSGWLVNVAFLGNFVGSLALLIALFRAYPPPFRSWGALICLGIGTLSVLTNFFPTDVHGIAITVAGTLHNTGAFVGTVAGLLFMLLLSRRLDISGFLQGWYRLVRVLAMVAPIGFLTMLISVERMPGWVGIAQRLYVATVLSWFMIAAHGIRSKAIIPSVTEHGE